MDYRKWREDAAALLVEKGEQRPLPKKENFLGDENANTFECQATGVSLECLSQLDEFYSVCNGFTWSNIFNGYFLMASSELGMVADRYTPTKLKSADGSYSDVFMIGSKGGGEMFVVKIETGEIMMLPGSRFESENVYDDWNDRTVCVASDFNSFLDVLLSDLTAYVKGDLDHQFVGR
jgi:hypothetical protein